MVFMINEIILAILMSSCDHRAHCDQVASVITETCQIVGMMDHSPLLPRIRVSSHMLLMNDWKIEKFLHIAPSNLQNYFGYK